MAPLGDSLSKPAYAVASVDHALRLIQILRDTGQLRLSDAAVELGVAPSTAHRLLAMLVYRGFASREDRGYGPGPALSAGPSGQPWVRDLRRAVRPHLELLSERTNETASVVILVGAEVRFLETVEASSASRVGDRAGTVLEAHKTSGGKAILAELDPDELTQMYRSRTAQQGGHLLDVKAFSSLLRDLRRIRVESVAVNNQQTERGVCAVGAAIHGIDGRPVAALSVALPTSRAPKMYDERVRRYLQHAVRDTEAALRDADILTLELARAG